MQGAPLVPITVERNLQRQWLVATATGVIPLEAILHVLQTARASEELRMWPMLFDGSAATTSMTDEDVATAVAVVRRAYESSGPRGHVALVARDNRFYALLLMCEIQCAEIGVRLSACSGSGWTPNSGLM